MTVPNCNHDSLLRFGMTPVTEMPSIGNECVTIESERRRSEERGLTVDEVAEPLNVAQTTTV